MKNLSPHCNLIYSSSIYHQVDKMIIELGLVRHLTQHAGEKGRECEGIVRGFLQTMLPQKFKVSTGFVVNESRSSNQVDVLVYNHQQIPPLYTGYEIDIVPIHSLACAIETKMLFSWSQLEKCQMDSAKIKELHSKSVKEEIEGKITEPFTMLFAFEGPTDKNMDEILDHSSIKSIDMFCFLNSGVALLNRKKKIYGFTPAAGMEFLGKSVTGFEVKPTHRLFIFAYSYLMDYLKEYESVFPDYGWWQSIDTLYFDG